MPRQGGAGEGAPAGGGGTLRKRGRGAPWRATGANAARGNAQPGEGGAGAGGGGAGGTPRPPGPAPEPAKAARKSTSKLATAPFSLVSLLYIGLVAVFVWKFNSGTTVPHFSILQSERTVGFRMVETVIYPRLDFLYKLAPLLFGHRCALLYHSEFGF